MNAVVESCASYRSANNQDIYDYYFKTSVEKSSQEPLDGQYHSGQTLLTFSARGKEFKAFSKILDADIPNQLENMLLDYNPKFGLIQHWGNNPVEDLVIGYEFMRQHQVCIRFGRIEVSENKFAEIYPLLPQGKSLFKVVCQLLSSKNIEKINEFMVKAAHLANHLNNLGITHYDFGPHNLWVDNAEEKVWAYDIGFHALAKDKPQDFQPKKRMNNMLDHLFDVFMDDNKNMPSKEYQAFRIEIKKCFDGAYELNADEQECFEKMQTRRQNRLGLLMSKFE